jgi:GT2 family glycosyltransferase
MLLDCFTDPCGVVIRRSAFDMVGGFAESQSLLYAEDHDLWLRLLENSEGVYVPSHGYAYRIHAGQVSNNPLIWSNAFNVLANAAKRYPYSKRVLRKRRAVLWYRKAQTAAREQRRVVSLCRLATATLLDPVRALTELTVRCKKRCGISVPATDDTVAI